MPSSFSVATKIGFGACLLGLSLAFTNSPVSATHSWGNYHWARTTNPFTLQLGDNVSKKWDAWLGEASSDWSQSSVLDTAVTEGGINPRSCKATTGKVQVCSAKYGFTGWLGVAQIWLSGDHIVQATAKLNDSYFDMPTYDKNEWRDYVMCQEIGHDFGLDHQNENHEDANLGTCMDYTNDPGGFESQLSNLEPNQHDYDMLETIYNQHLDSTTTVGSSALAAARADDWGKAVRFTKDGRGRVFVREVNRNERIVTFVIWIPE